MQRLQFVRETQEPLQRKLFTEFRWRIVNVQMDDTTNWDLYWWVWLKAILQAILTNQLKNESNKLNKCCSYSIVINIIDIGTIAIDDQLQKPLMDEQSLQSLPTEILNCIHL